MKFIKEVLDAPTILSFISEKNRAKLSKLELYETIDSTNKYLLSCAKKDLLASHVCLANEQTAGRGRLGKTWVSPKGANIYCSMLWRFQNLQHELSGLSIAVAVMVANVLGEYGVTLKWPNDILYQGKKLGGILLESNHPNTVVIGIGLNLYLPEEITELTNAIALPQNPSRNQLSGRLINELLAKLPVFEESGLRNFIESWRNLDAFYGKLVTIIRSDKQIFGKMLGINDKGELLLQDEAGILQQFCSGEVSLRLRDGDV